MCQVYLWLFSLANFSIIVFNIKLVYGYRSNYEHYKQELHSDPKSSSQQTLIGRSLLNQRRRPPVQNRIVGGRLVAYGEANYQVFLYNFYDTTDCGGTFVELNGFRFVITAAHCVWIGGNTKNSSIHVVPPEYLQVVGGTINYKIYNPRMEVYNVSRVEVHEDYDPRYNLRDIAILFLSRFGRKFEGMSTIPMARIDFDLPDWFTVSGFGTRATEGDEDGKLRVVDLPHFPDEECIKIVPYLNKYLFCVANIDFQQPKGDCFGDSGGPVVGYNWTTLTWFQYGIVSTGVYWECGKPTFHTRVSTHWDWINSKASDHLFNCGNGHPTEDSPSLYPNCRWPYSDPCYIYKTCKTDDVLFPEGR